MVRISVGCVLATVLACLPAEPAHADGCCCAAYVVVTSYPIRPVAQPVYVPMYTQPLPCPPGSWVTPVPLSQGYAIPQPAPPTPAPMQKKTMEPPLDKKQAKGPPQVIEPSKSFSLSGDKSGFLGAKEKCRVGFWNITGRDITLFVGEEKHVIPQNRSLTLMLDRQFSWHTGNGEPKRETVQDTDAHEIVLR
jgi:hypothetical protein